MRGFYFINTDLANTRAHTSQILQTAAAVSSHVPLSVVAPRYNKTVDLSRVASQHAPKRMPEVKLIWNFGIAHPGALAFVSFNLAATWFLLLKKIRGEAGFVYLRSTLLLPVAIVASLLRVPCFYETHRKPQNWRERWRDTLLVRLSAGLIVISAHVRTYYEKWNKPMLVAHDAVSLERFGETISKTQARQLFKLPEGATICVYSGSVSRLKGAHYIFDAARELPAVTFILAGRILPELRELALPSNVTLLGHLDQRKLPALLQAADVLVLPHPDNEYSQSPMKLFEYMASGVPIVAAKLPSISEVLDGTNALLVEPDNGKTLAHGIASALEHRAQSEERAREALRVVRGHTWDRRGADIAKFIEETLKK